MTAKTLGHAGAETISLNKDRHQFPEIIDGGPVRELRFRRDDQLGELAEIFNELMRAR